MDTTTTVHQPIEWTRVNNDINGNPRYVCHFHAFITEKDRANFGWGQISEHYKLAIKRANKLGGRKFHNKQYGGGIVFQSYNIHATEKQIKELMSTIK